MSDINAIGGVRPITAQDLRTLDLDSLMMLVQVGRASKINEQIKLQIDTVQQRNDKMAGINDTLNAINELIANFAPGSNDNTTLAAGVSPYAAGNATGHFKWERITLINKNTLAPDLQPFGPGGISDNTTKGQLNAAVQRLRSELDALSNTQQMDMLKLQTLTNKRNEATDTASNFVKKMADSRSSILGNMR